MNIEIKDLSVKYKNFKDEVKAVDNLDLTVDSGEICALIGPSGCGKTTMLYVLSGIIKNYTGEVLLGGDPVDPKLQRLGLVPQNYALLDWANVYDNAALGASITRRNINKQEITSFLSEIGLMGLEKKYPNTLSGGQKQRVSIARAFLMRPDILLMDEPFSALDTITREEMQDVFYDVWHKYKPTVIFVTHSIEEAVCIGQKIAIMSPAPGRIIRIVDNPLFECKCKRTSREHFDFILMVRKYAEKSWKIC